MEMRISNPDSDRRLTECKHRQERRSDTQMLLPGIGGKLIGAALSKKKGKKSEKFLQAKIAQLEQRVSQLEGGHGVGRGGCCNGNSSAGRGININIGGSGHCANSGYNGFRAPGFFG
jgi:hypothetical protein